LLASLLHFYSGQPLQNLSGVDKLLYAFVIVRLDRRDLIWIDVTRHPTAEWIARQITEAFPWNEAPRLSLSEIKSEHSDGVIRRELV